jgi:hypothetical protein
MKSIPGSLQQHLQLQLVLEGLLAPVPPLHPKQVVPEVVHLGVNNTIVQSDLQSGRPDWANFGLLGGDCFLWALFFKLQKLPRLLGNCYQRNF